MKISNHLLGAEADESVQFQNSPNQSVPFAPIHLLMHFTAGPTLEGAVEWFMKPEAQALPC